MALSVTYQMIRDAAATAKAEAEKLKNQPLLGAIIELQGFAFELQAENEELKRERDQRASMTFRDGAYWSDNPRNPGPFCPTCWGRDGKAVPIHTTYGSLTRYCHACETSVHMNPGSGMQQDDDFPPPREPIR